MVTFERDRKLDNRKESCLVYLIKISYDMGDKKIIEKRRVYTERTGWCFVSNNMAQESPSFSSIGKLSHYRKNGVKGWEIIVEQTDWIEGKRILIAALAQEKQHLLELATLIPYK